MSYRARAKGSYGFRRIRHVPTRKAGVVSKEEQDRHFREISEAFAGVQPSSHGTLAHVRQRLAIHKLYGETH